MRLRQWSNLPTINSNFSVLTAMNQLNIAIGLITVLSIVGAVAFIGSLLLSKYYSLRTGRKPFDKLITKLQPVGRANQEILPKRRG